MTAGRMRYERLKIERNIVTTAGERGRGPRTRRSPMTFTVMPAGNLTRGPDQVDPNQLLVYIR